MLDYKKLAGEIDQYIDSLDKQFIQNWLKETYANLSFPLDGRSFDLENDNESYDLVSETEVILADDNGFNYRSAA